MNFHKEIKNTRKDKTEAIKLKNTIFKLKKKNHTQGSQQQSGASGGKGRRAERQGSGTRSQGGRRKNKNRNVKDWRQGQEPPGQRGVEKRSLCRGPRGAETGRGRNLT